MSDATHPVYSDEDILLTKTYGRHIANQLALISPLYTIDNGGSDSPSYWAGRNFAWIGTSIPAGSDPALNVESRGTAYPALVAQQLGATVVNLARGSSMVRINACGGEYNGIPYHHFLRAATRTINEANSFTDTDVWAKVHENIPNAPAVIPSSDIAIMKESSYESFLMPYLDGTNPMPDLFVIDHGINDYAYDADNHIDFYVLPTVENIKYGLLAEDTWMTSNNYANLKTALGSDLSKIPDIESFAASLNRNCFIGAMNYLVTIILKYNPYARIVFISHYK